MVKQLPLSREARRFPLPHNFEFGFGLSAEASTKASTIVPYMFQDNALVDYETVKVNPDNADFAVSAEANVRRGSKIGGILIDYIMYILPSDTEINMVRANTMMISTNFLNRLDAADRKTGNDIETILELTHETTDEQVYPLWNGTKLFEGQGVYDYGANLPGLTTDQQPEGVAFDKEMFFDALHYYTNNAMLRKVTDKMLSITITDPLVNARHAIYHKSIQHRDPIHKSAEEYAFCGELFHVPQVGSIDQFHLPAQTTAIEHLCVKGRVRFMEYNNDFNFARA